MKSIVVMGAGKIGRMVGHLLGNCGDYTVRIGDVNQDAVDHITFNLDGASGQVVDFSSAEDIDSILGGTDAVISCAPFHCNPLIAARAKHHGVHYLDLTEDVKVTRAVAELAEGADTAFIPQCGLAPGFITITAVHLMNKLASCDRLRMRVGALPRFPSNRLKYNLTWSTEGLINEYCQPCEVIKDGKLIKVQPMQNLELITVDGVEYEGFNTSGGLGTLADTLLGKVRDVNYKSLRYPGHNELMKFLLNDLQMDESTDDLKRIFEKCLPGTTQDQIVIFVSATGTDADGRYMEHTYANTVYHQEIDGEQWTGIQVTTASGVCAVVDMLLNGELPAKGFVRQEEVDYEKFIANRFGKYYAQRLGR